jgi:molybdopterin/thiamine biosynthesis adenylyltransferase
MNLEALEFIKARSVKGVPYPTAALSVCREAAQRFGISPREAEITALRGGVAPLRYERGVRFFGLEGQAAILGSRAAVAGCGGLGGWIVEILARAGVGELVLIDGDTFGESNLNRQLYAEEGNMGKSKCAAAAERVAAINGAVTAIARAICIDETNAEGLFKGCSIAVDALDNNAARNASFEACKRIGIPFVHGAVGGAFAQSGVFRAGDIPVWKECGAPDRGAEAEMGTPPFTPPFAASIEAAEALLILSRRERPKNALLFFDIENMTMQKIKIRGRDE